MTARPPLPSTLQARLAALAGRIRLARALRSACLLVLCLCAVAGAAFLADWLAGYALLLLVRGALLAGWALLAVILSVSAVLPLFRRIDDSDLAAAVEQQYPELGERLLTTVELARDEHVSSPELARVLADETEARSAPLDFGQAASRRPVLWLALGACVAGLLLAVPAWLRPREAGTLARRFFLPWQSPGAEPEFAFRVEPGDHAAARGRPLAFAVALAPRDENVALPDTVQLTLTEASGKTSRHALKRQGEEARYEGSVRIDGDVEYRAEAGNCASRTYLITSVAPAELAPGSPTITITPPEYARVTKRTVTATGMVNLQALEHSGLTFRVALTRPARAGWVEWRAVKDGKSGEWKRLARLLPGDDGRVMTATAEPSEVGQYRLMLQVEHGVQTECEGGKVELLPDEAPTLRDFRGAEPGQKVRPYGRLSLEAKIEDDIAVGGAEFLYKVGDKGREVAEPMRLDGGKRVAVAKHVLRLAGKVTAGNSLFCRIRYRDNFPAKYRGPHVRYFPKEGAIRLEVAEEGGASPREEQVNAQRDKIAEELDKVRARLSRVARASDKARAETRNERELNRDQVEQVDRVGKLNTGLADALEKLAALADQEPETSPLADKAREVASQEVKRAGEALKKALDRGTTPEHREQQFRNAEKEYHDALEKLDGLKKENAKLAQARIDKARLEELADRQKQLAEQAAELEKEGPREEKAAKELRAEQEKAEKELKALADKSDLLKKALDEERAELAKQEAQKAEELARAQKDLKDAAAETEKKAERERLAGLAGKQSELADRAEKLSRDTAPALEADRAKPLNTDNAKKAAGSLREGESERARLEQDRAARDLEQLARELDRIANQSNDPREAARQLAIMEEGLAKRTREAELAPKKREELGREQRAIREALEGLSVPPNRAGLEEQRKKATGALVEAEKALKEANRAEAGAKLDKARDQMRRLAGMMPSREERVREAKAELERARKEQEDVGRLLESGKLDEAGRKQEALAEKLSKLDAPNEEWWRERAREEMARAAREMKAGDADEARVSEARAQKELERLAESLGGKKSAGEQARELAARQRELKAEADKPEAARKQRDLAEEVKRLPAKDEPSAKREAEKAARAAAEAAKKGPAEEKAAMEEAAKKLDELARALSGKENDAKKAERLAKRQAEAAPDDEKRLEDIARELKGLRAGDARKEKKAAQEAVAEAAKAKGEAKPKAERGAAERLKALADKLAKQKPEAKAREGRKPSPLASKEQADAARKLAKEQRELREALAKEMEKAREERKAAQAKPDGRASKLAKEQKEIAKEARELAEAVRGERGEKSAAAKQADEASKRAGEASRGLDSGALEKAMKGGQDAEKALRELGQSLKDRPSEKARELERKQAKLNKELEPLAKQVSAQRECQNCEQAELAREAGRLAQRLQGLAGKGSPMPGAQDAGKKAATAAREAAEAMQQARQSAQRGDQGAAQRARERAAEALERAARMARQSAGNQRPNGEAGRELRQAGGQMNDAQQQLGKGQSGDAARSMAQAGDALQRAADALSRMMQPQNRPGRPMPRGEASVGGGAAPGGKVDDRMPPGKLPFDPRKWGDLPGEQKAKFMHELQKKYGYDYADAIKQYFEQLADTRKR